VRPTLIPAGRVTLGILTPSDAGELTVDFEDLTLETY
jgi:hypothetical protein